jgi:hypothetical protein
MQMVNALLWVSPVNVDISTVKLNVPPVVGVPVTLIVGPLPERLKPFGREPDTTCQMFPTDSTVKPDAVIV